MSDYDLPELPSDEELGITDEDREKLEEKLPRDRPELSKEEMVALLGETFSPKKAGAPPPDAAPKKRWWRRKAEKQRDRAAGGGGKGGPATGPAPVAEGPRSRWRGPATLAMLVGVALFSSSRTGLPDPVPANAADTVFSSSRAMSVVIDIARDPHPTGSPEHTRVREYLLARLRALGLEPQVQTATSMLQQQGAARVATVRNVLARLPGTASTGAVLVTAHYDSRELAPGASDDGAGVAAILEATRAVLARAPLRNDVIVLLADAEELGLLGARAFVEGHPWLEDVAVVLSFDNRGGAGPSIMFETNEENGWVVRALAEFDPHPFANSLAYEVYRRLPNDTDFTPFKEAGKQGMNFAAIDRVHVYHQSLDTPENLSESMLQHHGLRALAGLEYFGRADLASVNARNAVYFTVPFWGLVVYGAGWVLPISGGLIALLALALVVVRRSGGRLWRAGAGLGLAALAGALSYGAAVGLTGWITRFHPEAGSLAAAQYHSEGWYVLSLVAAAFTIVTAVHAVARRWLSLVELSLGAVVVPLGLAVGLGFVAPFGAMNLQWPTAAALLSVLLAALLGARVGGVVGWITGLLLAVPVLVLLTPVVELLWIAMSLAVAGVLVVLVTMTLQLCLPALDALRHPNGWWAPVTGLLVGASALGLGVLAARPSADRPAPSTLVYLYEHGTGTPLWATDPVADAELDAEGLAWAAQRAGATFSEVRDISDFGFTTRPAPVAPAQAVSAPPPQVTIVSDTIDGDARRVELAVRSAIGAEMIRFQRDRSGGTRLLSVSGQALAAPDSLRWIEHWGVPDSTIALRLEMPAGEAIGIHIVEHLLRPELLLGPDAFTRPPELAPDVSTFSDRAVLRYSVATFADPRHALVPTAPPEGALLPPPDEGAAGASGPAPGDSVSSPAPRDTLESPRPAAR